MFKRPLIAVHHTKTTHNGHTRGPPQKRPQGTAKTVISQRNYHRKYCVKTPFVLTQLYLFTECIDVD
jgi:hypothetical protein